MLTPVEVVGLPVYTQSGQFLGKVKRIILDPLTQGVSQYVVGSRHWLKRFLVKELLISPLQVISLTREKMVVADNVVKSKSQTKIGLAVAPTAE